MSDTTEQVGGRLRLEQAGAKARLVAQGNWTVRGATKLDKELHDLDFGGASAAEIDASQVSALDSAGAWLLLRTKREMQESGISVAGIRVPEVYLPLMAKLNPDDTGAVEMSPLTLTAYLERIGRATHHFFAQAYAIFGFVGRVMIETMEVPLQRGSLRLKSWVHQMDETGVTALPILGLLSFLLGVVIAYQGADQLKRFGAELFTVNLLGAAMLREIGGLIAAIIVAGRSGSAFTAQIGTMKLNQEIDAIETMGLNVVELLVLPRVLGLLITLPILTLYADVMGILGGGIMCYFYLDINIPAFLRQLSTAVTLNTMMVGLIKAPVFAVVIAMVGCFEGLQVEGNAGSVGRLTTRSVVEFIFLVMVFDAGFSILFSLIGI